VKQDVDFLWWLERFIGEWRVGACEYQVRRADNGWPNAFELPAFNRVPLEVVLESGVRTTASGPLGPYPVTLSGSMMETWLTPNEQSRFHGALHVSAGRDRVIEAIENSIAGLDEGERKRRWTVLWTGARKRRADDIDAPYLEELQQAFRAGGHS
jgi:hypothetical protein